MTDQRADRITADRLTEWLDEVLDRDDDKRPSRQAMEAFAARIEAWCDSDALQREALNREIEIVHAAEALRRAVAYRHELANVAWMHPMAAAAAEADDVLAQAGVSAVTPESPRRGKPPADWRKFGHWFAREFIALMRDAGSKVRLSARDRESVTAAIGAKVINHGAARARAINPDKARANDLDPAGFASGMSRRPSRRTSLWMARKIRVLPAGQP